MMIVNDDADGLDDNQRTIITKNSNNLFRSPWTIFHVGVQLEARDDTDVDH